ncbi:hypothetical protein HDU84_009390, partial [Entophlyctis sp. JEL0112]
VNKQKELEQKVKDLSAQLKAASFPSGTARWAECAKCIISAARSSKQLKAENSSLWAENEAARKGITGGAGGQFFPAVRQAGQRSKGFHFEIVFADPNSCQPWNCLDRRLWSRSNRRFGR